MSGDLRQFGPELDEAECPVDDRDARVLHWRAERLIAAGYDGETALLLAFDTTVDLHQATDLVERGCPVATAVRILT
ncbi:MAG: hypothetical protein ACXWZP_07125 [Gaiellaceae bacterium]